jgi:tetratricopeptide (TPR) repeat protein
VPEFSPRPVFRLGDRLVDLERRRVSCFEADVPLTGAEAALLEALHDAAGAPLDRQVLTTGILGFSPRARTRTLDTLLWRLRAKIEVDPAEPRHLVSLRQRGLALLGAEPVAAVDTTQIIGRESERARLLEWLARPGVVQVVAPAGYGKSALRRALAADAVALFGPGGHVVTLDLAAVAGADSLALALAARFGMDPRALDDLGAALATRGPTLLLLDSAELMVESASELLSRVLPRAADLRVAVFSRVLLPLAGGHSLELEPLAPDAARRMLMQRLAEDGHDAARLDAALAVSDGIPLALELAAAQIVAGHAIDATRVAAALEAALERSWANLPSGSREDLIRIEALRGPFDVQLGASLLTRTKTSTVDGLEVLRRHSLLHAEPSGRFRVPESVRAWICHIAAEPHAAARLKHARIFADVGGGALNRARWEQLRRSAVDLHAALVVLDDNARAEPADGERHARLLRGLLPLATYGALIATDMLQQHAMRAWERCVDPGSVLALACVQIGLALHTLDLENAERWFARVAERDHPDVAALEARYAIMCGVEGETATRLERIRRSLPDDSPQAAELLARLGAVHGRFGRMREAAAALEACLALPAEARWPGLDVEVRQQLATAYIIMRPGLPGPERLYAEARRMAEESELFRYVPVIVANRTTFHYLAGDTEAALASAHEALALARRSGRAVVVAQAFVALAGVALRRDERARAAEALADARAYAGGDTQQGEQIAHLEALLALAERDVSAARWALARVGTLGTRAPLDGLVALHRALVAWLEGERDEARQHLEDAARRASGLGRADVALAIELAQAFVGGASEVPAALFRRWQRLDARPGQTGMAAEQIRLLLQWFQVRPVIDGQR